MSDSRNSSSPPPPRDRRTPPRFQFSLAGLMTVVTITALLLGVSTLVDWSVFKLVVFELIFASMVWYVLPASLIACAIYGRGDFQAFAIGALVPYVSSLFGGGPLRQASTAGAFWTLVYLLLVGGVCGVVAVLTRRWIEQHGGE